MYVIRLTDLAKRGLTLDKRPVIRLCACLFVWMYDDYGHTPWLIFMNFGFNIFGTKVEWLKRKDIIIDSRFEMADVFRVFLVATVKTLEQFLYNN